MKFLLFLFLTLPLGAFAQQGEFQLLHSGTPTSLRGLSVVSDQVAWVSGSKGHVGKTVDGGKTWHWVNPDGYDDFDFRDIEASDAKRAVIVNAGSPAFILLTVDGGKSWQTTYRNIDSAIFLDGFDFWDAKRGIVMGDPINHKLQLFTTADGGQSWKDISDHLNMEMADGEASFAASGTTIKTLGAGKVWIATGGKVSNIYYSADYGGTWTKYPCPILQGENSTGPFSIDFATEQYGVAVGGNYLKDQESPNNALITKNGGKDWEKPVQSVSGYRSGVTFLNTTTCIAVGTSGADLSRDGGRTWVKVSDKSFNAVQRAKKGKLVLAAGANGSIYKLPY